MRWRNLLIGSMLLCLVVTGAELIQRQRHPHVGFRGMYNALGFRGREFSVKKEPGTTRILFVGSSTTFGIGNDVRNTFPVLTETLLNKNLQTARVEAINGAVPGKNSSWVLKRIKESLYLKPDIFIVMVGYNDSASAYSERVIFDKEGTLIIRSPWYHKLSVFLTRHSVFYVTLREKIALILFGDPRFAFGHPNSAEPNIEASILAEWFKHYPSHYRDNLEGMVTMAETHSIKVIFLKAPLGELRKRMHPLYAKAFFRLRKELANVSSDFNVPLIDLDEPLSGPESAEYFSEDGIHFTDKGNLKIAETISEFLLESNEPWQY